jgi:hypothetical protein
VEDGLAGGSAIEQVVDDAGEIDGKSAGHGVGLAGKTRCLAISEPRSFLPEMAYDSVVSVLMTLFLKCEAARLSRHWIRSGISEQIQLLPAVKSANTVVAEYSAIGVIDSITSIVFLALSLSRFLLHSAECFHLFAVALMICANVRPLAW